MEWIESKMKLNASEWNRRKGISVCGDLYGFFFVVACFRQIFFLVVVYIIFIFCFHCCVWDFLKWIHFLMKRNRFLKNKIHVKKTNTHTNGEKERHQMCHRFDVMWNRSPVCNNPITLCEKYYHHSNKIHHTNDSSFNTHTHTQHIFAYDPDYKWMNE